jgi:hypothetical protein
VACRPYTSTAACRTRKLSQPPGSSCSRSQALDLCMGTTQEHPSTPCTASHACLQRQYTLVKKPAVLSPHTLQQSTHTATKRPVPWLHNTTGALADHTCMPGKNSGNPALHWGHQCMAVCSAARPCLKTSQGTLLVVQQRHHAPSQALYRSDTHLQSASNRCNFCGLCHTLPPNKHLLGCASTRSLPVPIAAKLQRRINEPHAALTRTSAVIVPYNTPCCNADKCCGCSVIKHTAVSTPSGLANEHNQAGQVCRDAR